ncbi:hypothetical protein ABW20_dc0108550 [Dactylellina cionopaga]|nr:hypothetical protein ABW20_dc0108550 [Dactylellina cionopaga]
MWLLLMYFLCFASKISAQETTASEDRIVLVHPWPTGNISTTIIYGSDESLYGTTKTISLDVRSETVAAELVTPTLTGSDVGLTSTGFNNVPLPTWVTETKVPSVPIFDPPPVFRIKDTSIPGSNYYLVFDNVSNSVLLSERTVEAAQFRFWPDLSMQDAQNASRVVIFKPEVNYANIGSQDHRKVLKRQQVGPYYRMTYGSKDTVSKEDITNGFYFEIHQLNLMFENGGKDFTFYITRDKSSGTDLNVYITTRNSLLPRWLLAWTPIMEQSPI